MKPTLIVCIISLLLFGCAPTSPEILTTTQQSVVMPPDEMFDCPEVAMFPDAESLDDIEVGKLLKQLYSNNEKCFNSVQAIHLFLTNAKAITDKKPVK